MVLVGLKSGIFCKPVKNHEALTTGNDNPNKIHEKVIEPKVVSLRSAIGESLMIMIEHACRVVQNVAINLAQRNHGLKRMTEGMLSSN